MGMTEISLIFTMRDKILTKFRSSWRSIRLKIPVEHFSDDPEDHPNQPKNNKKSNEKRQYPTLHLKAIHWNWNYLWREATGVALIELEDKNKSRRAGLWKSLPGIWVEKLLSFKTKIDRRNHWDYQFHWNRLISP